MIKINNSVSRVGGYIITSLKKDQRFIILVNFLVNPVLSHYSKNLFIFFFNKRSNFVILNYFFGLTRDPLSNIYL